MPDDIDTTTPAADEFNPRIEPVDLQVEMQRSYMDYAMSVIVSPRAARRPRRPQAGAPPRALRDVRRRLPSRPRLLQVRAHRRRRHGQLPPARRLLDLRHPRAPVPAVGAALPARAGPGQLRLAGQRPRRRHALHRGADGPARHGDGARHRRGDRRLHAQLRRPHPGAGDPAEPVPQPAGQRQRRHRGRHGHQHPAAQPARGRRGRAVGARPPRGHARGAARGAARAGQGPRLPHRRTHRGPQGDRGRLPHRPRVGHDARGGRGRRRTAAAARCWSSPSCPTRSTRTTCCCASPSSPTTGKIAGISDVRDDSSSRTGMRLVIELKRDAVAKVVLNNLYKHTVAAGQLRLQHDRARRRRAAHADARRVRPALDHPPDRGHRPAHPLPPAQGRGARAHPARLPQGPRRPRRGHRAHPRVAPRSTMRAPA